jgi:cytoskeletal protein CcmA (bactofilin family)
MFQKKNDGDRREGVTLIGEEAYFNGMLAVKGSLRVEGSVEGDVSDAVSVEIGPKGRVKGNISAESLSVAGVVEGDVTVTKQIELLANSRLRGNIRAGVLRIEEGASFDGSCSMAPAEKSFSVQEHA